MKIRATLFVAIALAACSSDLPTSTDPLTTPSVSTLAGATGQSTDTVTTPDTTTHHDTTARPDTVTHHDTTTSLDTVTHHDTTTRPDTTTGPDTTGTPYTGVVHLSGHVLGQTLTVPPPPGSDSIQSTPIAGAAVKLYRNVLVNGSGSSVYVGEVVTGADGSYQFNNLPGGYYWLRTSVPLAPWAGNYISYIRANAAEITEDLRIWPHN